MRLLLLFLFLHAQSVWAANFSLGAVVATATQSPQQQQQQLQSDSGTFVLGFAPAQQQQQQWKLAIWYAADPGKVPLWSAPSSDATVATGSTLRLSESGDLQLLSAPNPSNSSSSSIIWSSGTAGSGVASGSLNDSGCLFLTSANGSTVWSSFSHPLHTLLPAQPLGGGAVLTSAPYSAALDPGGNLTLTWTSTVPDLVVPYWVSDTPGAVAATLDSNGVLNLLSGNATSATIRRFFPSDYGPSQLRRLTLDADGNLRLYTLDTGSWLVRWQALEDQCRVFGYCGPFGICGYDANVDHGNNSDNSQVIVPSCSCPPGLQAVDPRRPRAGCTGGGGTNCTNGVVQPLAHATWLLAANGPSASAAQLSVSNNEDGCKSSCLNDATCTACLVPADGSGVCIQFRSANVSALSLPYVRSAAFVKLCDTTSVVTPTATSSSCAAATSCSARQRGDAAALAAGVTLAAVAAVHAGLWWRRRRRRRRLDGAGGAAAPTPPGSGLTPSAAVSMSYRQLELATNGFSERIGEGGFGAVYKGRLDGVEVAVKKLEGLLQGDKEFSAEVATLGSTHHVNLMHLLAFCSSAASGARLLVYEYMPGASLDRHLFRHPHDAAALAPLTWAERRAVALGTARGVAYLHDDCRQCIVHCDLKPENILLDAAMIPRVSDFGLARLVAGGGGGGAVAAASIRGTRGYLAPEWLTANAPLTPKADVYSYGVVLLELVAGRRSYDVCPLVPAERRRLPAWAFDCLQQRRPLDVLEGGGGEVGGGSAARELEAEVERLLRVAFWCLQDSPQQRPGMRKVVHMLDGTVPVSMPPQPSAASSSSVTSSSATTTSNTSSSVVTPSSASSSILR